MYIHKYPKGLTILVMPQAVVNLAVDGVTMTIM